MTEYTIQRGKTLELSESLRPGDAILIESQQPWRGGNHTSISLQDPKINETHLFVSFQEAEDRILLNSYDGPGSKWRTEILLPNLHSLFPRDKNASFTIEYNNQYYNVKINEHSVGGMFKQRDGSDVKLINYLSDGEAARSAFSDTIKVTVIHGTY